MAAGLPRRVAAAAADRDRADHAAAVCARGRRARGADGGGRRRRYLRKDGWLKLYRSDRRSRRRRASSSLPPIRHRQCAARRRCGARARAVARAGLPPCRALAGRGEREQSAGGHPGLCGALRRARRASFNGDARSLHRADGHWRVDTDEGPVDAAEVVVALGPWAPDLLDPLGIRLPLAVKRGYHRHFRPQAMPA